MELQKTLYKFRDWNEVWHKKILENSEIYFSSNEKLNDPFDVNIPFRIADSGEFDENMFRDDYRRIHGTEPDRKLIYSAKKEFPEIIKGDSIIKTKVISDFENNIQAIEKKFGIFCLSKDAKSPPMWAHYADKGKGFCLGFDSDELCNFFSSQSSIKTDIAEVSYQKEFPKMPITVKSNDLNKYAIARRTTKYLDWQYESEVRIILNGVINQAIKIPERIITEIIFGLDMCESHKQELSKLCKEKFSKIKLFEARMSKNNFKIEFTEL